jgi:hypothetical protein
MSYLKHKPGSIEELMSNEAAKLNDNAYQDMFKKELDKAGKGIGSMTPKEKKDFFNKVDDKYKAKNEEVNEEDAYDNERFIIIGGKAKIDGGNTPDKKDHVYAPDAKTALQLHKQGKKVYKEELSAAQKKLPAGLQKAIKDKETKSESLINTYESLIKTWEAASHKMPDGTMMKGAKHKDETKDEANDVDRGDEKKPVATKGVKKLADSGSKLTKVETEPNADFRN